MIWFELVRFMQQSSLFSFIICSLFYRGALDNEQRYRANEFTANTLLRNITKLYGRTIVLRSMMWNKSKIQRLRLQESQESADIEEQDGASLAAALQVERDREEETRIRDALENAFTDELINWDFNFEPLPGDNVPDPHADAVLCWGCQEEVFERLSTSCGCEGYCRDCLSNALHTAGNCPYCKRPFDRIIVLNQNLQTKSREIIELQQQQQQQQQQRAEDPDYTDNEPYSEASSVDGDLDMFLSDDDDDANPDDDSLERERGTTKLNYRHPLYGQSPVLDFLGLY